MKIGTKLEERINQQIQMEFQSRYAYLGLSAWFETTPFRGFAAWMRRQASEENFHAMKFFDYLVNRFGTVELMPIAAPSSQFDSPLHAFQVALDHERKVTASIHALYEAALAEKDYQTMEFLNWFLREQVEEEKTVQDLIDELTLAAEDRDAMMRLDEEAGRPSGSSGS